MSSPDRVIFPATERTPEITKLGVVEYYLAVEDGIMRALDRRPTTLERWPKGVHPGIGPSRGMHQRILAGDPVQRVLDRLLDAWPMVLVLPPHERAPIIFDGERETGQS